MHHNWCIGTSAVYMCLGWNVEGGGGRGNSTKLFLPFFVPFLFHFCYETFYSVMACFSLFCCFLPWEGWWPNG